MVGYLPRRFRTVAGRTNPAACGGPDMTEETIFAEALTRRGAGERAAFLEAACGGDAALRERVEALIRSHDDAGSFLEVPAVGNEQSHADDETRTVPGPAESGDIDVSFLAPSEQPGHLGRLGEFEVLQVVGRGGMGVVFKAFDASLHRVVAIKAMAPQLAANTTARRRFEREGQAAAAVVHDHIVTIHQVGEANGLPIIVMQYVGGVSLQQRL